MPVYLFDTSKLHPNDLNGILASEIQMCGIQNPYGRSAVPYETIEMYANNDRVLRVYAKTADLNIVNLTGAVGVFTVKTDKTATLAVITKHTNVPAEGQIGAADEGEMFFYIVPADTVHLDIRQYVFSIRITLSTGKTYTILEGVINLEQPVG